MCYIWVRGADRILVRKPEEKSHFVDLGIDGRIILKLVVQKQY
jgi:hypothetical protein